ncbi:serine/threonine protein kinase [Calothrix sp. 336/3]|uniref:serine/threonine protein kinase n=1 Tax=Calothrix sp. 336/3 TaxID=1337936 RepID=UPI00054F7262|nr:serine/threonine protein kinase [Calothrix sp. 336/3]AKG22767.1 serine/threonine protein kinase [Calothrix sp. 336/3]
MIGKLLDHRYQVIRVLATGGFGETYIAQDTKRPGNPMCVVKHLKPASTDPKVFDTAKRLFHSEAETLEKLGSHPQIPRLLAYFDENQEFYLVQEFVEGHPLGEELIAGKSWREADVLRMLLEVLDILAFVHSQGVIHRDIKPDNIIRRMSDGKLVLVDFGAVKQLRTPNSLSATNISLIAHASATVAIGTPGYMSTEQGQGKPRPNSDIYALGIIAIQALTGISPVDLQEDPQSGELIWQHLTPIHPDFAGILGKMVRYHFKERYQNARDALQALQSLPMAARLAEIPVSRNYQLLPSTSPHSRQKTVALAPANSTEASQVKNTTQLEKRNRNRPDFLQLFILLGLAGGAAYAAPSVVKNFQGIAANFIKNDTSVSADVCVAMIGNANIRSEPSSLNSENIVKTVETDTQFEVTGKQTRRGWVQLKLSGKNSGWAHRDVIKNNEEWSTCLRDKGIAIRTVDDQGLIASRGNPKGKSIVDITNSILGKSQVTPSVGESDKPQTATDSNQVMDKARAKYESGDFQGAIALLKTITNNPAGVQEAANMMSQWQQDWTKAEALFNDINKALENGQWDKVAAYKDHPEKLPNTEYWRKKIEPLVQQAADNVAKEVQKSTNEGLKPKNPEKQN